LIKTRPEGVPLEEETVTIELWCTNRHLPAKLGLEDIRVPAPSSPAFARFRNLTRVAPTVPPPLGGDLHWRLLSHLTLNYLSLGEAKPLREVLSLYHFRAPADRQAQQDLERTLAGIRRVAARQVTRLFRGAPVRGVAIELDLDEESFAGEGDLYLFAAVLNEFFSLYVTLNSFSKLTVKGSRFQEVYEWPAKLGGRSIL
ncbi:MAG: type VI secretion system baseplate subunit TssF, partial [Thermoanaerobaculia bacterium]